MFFTLLLLLTFAFPAVQATRDPDAIVPASDGVPIYYSVQGTGDTALVFVHCWSCDRSLWKNQVPEFSKKYRVVTIDLPGHGKSGQGRKNWSIESYGEDVKTVVTKLDLKRVVLVGSSMGGPITLEAARRMPDRVVGIVPVDTLHNVEERVPPDQLDAVVKQLQADYKTAVTGFLNQFFFGPKTPAAVKARVTADVTSRPPELAVTIFRDIFAYDAAPALREIKVPIRAINANLRPTNLTVNQKYAPQFNLVVMEGFGHYPMLEDPATFNRHLAEFVQSLPRK